jgi:pyridoxine 5-phosphate synthase
VIQPAVETRLSVNVNAIAQLRNRRNLPWPSVTGLCAIALEAGADGITVHPRPDERHIRRADVFEVRKLLRTQYPGREFNIEGYPGEAFLALVEEAKPDQVTLVPDAPGQATSDHGWDCVAHRAMLTGVVTRLQQRGMRVSLFIDADPAAARAAAHTGTDHIEVYTGPYGHCFDPSAQTLERDKLVATAQAANAFGLGVNAGHDLTLTNLPPLKAAIPFLAEVSIGHALTTDALVYGMAETVRRYRAAARGGAGL